jgi:hypothetical protein
MILFVCFTGVKPKKSLAGDSDLPRHPRCTLHRIRHARELFRDPEIGKEMVSNAGGGEFGFTPGARQKEDELVGEMGLYSSS